VTRPGAWRRVPAVAAGVTRAAALAATVLMTVLILAEIVARGVFRTSTFIADEMAGYLLVVLASLGLADSLASGSFIRVTFLQERLSPGVRRGVDRALLLVALAYTSLLAYHLWAFVLSSYTLETRSIFLSRTPLWIPRAGMALGVTALVLQLGAQILRPASSEPLP
jgi:TRAP-type C4-dicarboxylate transport system permease small subunit